MDLKPTTTTTTSVVATATPTSTDSPETDGETPLNYLPLIKPLSSFPNGTNHHHNQQPPSTMVTYKQCLKNHAATIGSHALDGCGEFMPLLTHAPQEPTSLKCAACGCHRNFHRREHVINDMHGYAPHVLLSFTAADHHHQPHIVATPGTPAETKNHENTNGRKRFRTKFSQDQKDKMYLFAEKVGWKMQRCDDKTVLEFCNEVGIKRGVFKVWMHNNKHTVGGKKELKETNTSCSPATAPADVITSVKSYDVYNNGNVNVDNSNSTSDNIQEKELNSGGGAVHLHASNNGSSKSSSC